MISDVQTSLLETNHSYSKVERVTTLEKSFERSYREFDLSLFQCQLKALYESYEFFIFIMEMIVILDAKGVWTVFKRAMFRTQEKLERMNR